MSDLDLNRLLQGHVVLSALAAFDNVPAWNLPLSLVGLVVVPQLADGQGAESVRQVRPSPCDLSGLVLELTRSSSCSSSSRSAGPSSSTLSCVLCCLLSSAPSPLTLPPLVTVVRHAQHAWLRSHRHLPQLAPQGPSPPSSSPPSLADSCLTTFPPLSQFITIATALSSLRARGQGSFNLPGGMGGAGGFSIPGGLADRLPTGFPPFGQQQQRQQQESETGASAFPLSCLLSSRRPSAAATGGTCCRTKLTPVLLPAVWSAPAQQPTSYQPRFSLDEEASAGSATPPHQAAPTSTSFGGGAGGKKGGAAAHSAPQAEGGGYHSLE